MVGEGLSEDGSKNPTPTQTHTLNHTPHTHTQIEVWSCYRALAILQYNTSLQITHFDSGHTHMGVDVRKAHTVEEKNK